MTNSAVRGLSSTSVAPNSEDSMTAMLPLLIVEYCHVFGGVWLIDGVWIRYSIYWPLAHTTRNHTLQFTDTHRLVSSVYWPLPRETLRLPALRSSCHSRPFRIVKWQLNLLGSGLAAVSHQPPSLLFTGWLPTDNWTLSLTIQLLPVTSHN
jgi:hypothetical protein